MIERGSIARMRRRCELDSPIAEQMSAAIDSVVRAIDPVADDPRNHAGRSASQQRLRASFVPLIL